MIREHLLEIEKLVEGMNPDDPNTIALREAAIARPVPAIEKPLGPRTLERPMAEGINYNVSGAFSNWNDVARKHPWG